MRSRLFLTIMLLASAVSAADAPLTIAQLLAQGWEIAGYASGYYQDSMIGTDHRLMAEARTRARAVARR